MVPQPLEQKRFVEAAATIEGAAEKISRLVEDKTATGIASIIAIAVELVHEGLRPHSTRGAGGRQFINGAAAVTSVRRGPIKVVFRVEDYVAELLVRNRRLLPAKTGGSSGKAKAATCRLAVNSKTGAVGEFSGIIRCWWCQKDLPSR